MLGSLIRPQRRSLEESGCEITKSVAVARRDEISSSSSLALNVPRSSKQQALNSIKAIFDACRYVDLYRELKDLSYSQLRATRTPGNPEIEWFIKAESHREPESDDESRSL